MADGIATIVSRIGIPEKINEVQERAAENRQDIMTTYSQQQAEKRLTTVQKLEKTAGVRKVRKEKNTSEDPEKKKKKKQFGSSGKNLDTKA